MPKINITDTTEKLRRTVADLSSRDFKAGELYKSLFEDSHTIMLIINPESGEIIDANSTACKYYQYMKEQIVKMNIMDINVLSPKQVYKEMQNAKTERRNYFNFKHKLSNGEIRDVEVYSSPITIAGKKLLYSIVHDISKRKENEMEREKLISDLEKALAKVKLLSGFLPICASCKNIRDDKGYWNQIESYIRDHSEAEFSHSICPECAKKLYPKL